MHDPASKKQIDEFINAVRICSPTLQHVELTDDDEISGVLCSYVFRFTRIQMNCAAIMKLMNIQEMKGLHVFRIVGVSAIGEEDVRYFLDNVPSEAPLTNLALRRTKYLNQDTDVLSLPCTEAFVEIIEKFSSTLETLTVNEVKDEYAELLINAVAEARLKAGHKLQVSYSHKDGESI